MPRPLRVHVPGGFYHVTLRGNHQRAIFVHDGDQRLLNVIVVRALTTFDVKLHAYCWMTNHIHLLLQVSTEPLSRPMRSIASEFAREMQKKLATTGHFFERRYHASLVAADAYLLQLIRYIHLNPVKAGIVDHPGQYPWSSHHAYVGSRNEAWVSSEFALSLFGSNRASAMKAYRAFLDLPEALDWEPTIIADSAPVDAPKGTQVATQRAGSSARPISLDCLIEEACQRYKVDVARLAAPIRDRYLTVVRAWIAHQAIARGICGISAVARALGRDESTLRQAIREHRSELA